MGQTVDIGKRIELVPMDPHFHDITIALYQQGPEESPLFLVHTYSQIEGAQERIQFAIEAMTHHGKPGCDCERAAPVPLRIRTSTGLQANFSGVMQAFAKRVSGTTPLTDSGQKVRANHHGR